MPNFGAIYIVHNPRDGEDVYKVGKTERDLQSRIAELNAHTTNLGRYFACAFFVVSDVNAAEQACHIRLRQYRVQENREFFGLELRRLLPLVQEAVKPFLAQSFVPPISEPEARASDLNGSLSERLQRQRESAINAAQVRQSKEGQAKAELLARIKAWREELDTKIRIVREAYADLECIQWEEGWLTLSTAVTQKWVGLKSYGALGLIEREAAKGFTSIRELVARVQSTPEYKALDTPNKDRMLREFAADALAKGKITLSQITVVELLTRVQTTPEYKALNAPDKDRMLRELTTDAIAKRGIAPSRSTESAQETGVAQSPLIAHVSLYAVRTGKPESDRKVEPGRPAGEAAGKEKSDDPRLVGKLLMSFCEGIVKVAAFSDDGKVGSMQGEATCVNPDEAIDLFGALISEYAAQPITEAGPASRYKTALFEGAAGGSQNQT